MKYELFFGRPLVRHRGTLHANGDAVSVLFLGSRCDVNIGVVCDAVVHGSEYEYV